MENVRSHLSLLGKRVEDKVTGLTGVVDSISFDLYGCVQATINPGLDKDGNEKNSRWYDISRLDIKNNVPVMDVPDFEFGPIAEGLHGPANKPYRNI